jgi:hypothetical protein
MKIGMPLYMEIGMPHMHGNWYAMYAWKLICPVCMEISMPHMHGNNYAPYT